MSGGRLTTEIIAISSGKGGTGKTFIAACLGYSLKKAGHAVLMIDADPGTDGLSLFLLGPDGMATVERDVQPENTYRYFLENPSSAKAGGVAPFSIHRREDAHSMSYDALISAKTLYGNLKTDTGQTVEFVIPRLDRTTFREALKGLFAGLREAGRFDYVLVDTRGGFAFESTDICALADSFIVVTEPDYTSFYQDRNLIQWVNRGAEAMSTRPLLRAIIVNKATDGEERSFRLELEREFPVKFDETHPIPLDVNAISAYRHQLIPYAVNPGSDFAAHTIQAFSRIMRVVTSQWDSTRVDAWNDLVRQVSEPFVSRSSVATRLKAAMQKGRWAAVALAVVLGSWGGSAWLSNQAEEVRIEQIEVLYSPEESTFNRTANLKALLDAGETAFYGADLSDMDLSRFDLNSARLQRADFRGAILAGADLAQADLTGAINLTQSQVNSALGDSGTLLPEGLERPASWMREAEDTKAVSLYERACEGGDSLGCRNLGYMYENGRGVDQDYTKAASLYKQACDGGDASGCLNLGIMYQNGQGVDQDEVKAVSLYERACEGDDSLGCSNLGDLYLTRGELDLAETFYRRSLALNEGLGNREGIADDYNNLGDLNLIRGKLGLADTFYRESLALNEKLGNREGTADNYFRLGDLYLTSEELDEAEAFYRRSLALNMAVEDKERMADTYFRLGYLYSKRGQLDEARDALQQSTILFYEVGSPQAQTVLDFLNELKENGTVEAK